MNDKNLYFPLWQKYKPAIIIFIKSSIDKPQQYQLFKHEFEALGNRTKSNYIFNLEIVNGICINDISGSAVARDLLEILYSSSIAKAIFKENNIKINMGKDFILHIQKL